MPLILPLAATWFFGLAVIGFPLALFFADKTLALVASVMLGAVVATVLRDRALGVVVVATVFQNLMVSLASPWLQLGDFTFARSFSFLNMVLVWVFVMVAYLRDREALPPEIRRMMRESILVLAVIFAFLVIGLPRAGGNAIVYTRNIATPILFFQIALLTSLRHRIAFGPLLVSIAAVIVVVGGFEWLDRREYLYWTNGDTFWELSLKPLQQKGILAEYEQYGEPINHITDFFKVVLFNTALLADLDMTILRLYGPNGHPISYGYLLAFLILVLVSSRQRLLAVALLPLLVYASAKGAVVVLLMSGTAYAIWRVVGARLAALGLGGLYVVYVLFTFVSGLRGGDYHVLGLMGGLKGFLANPIGHGIGVGGNLEGTLSASEWNQAQAAGSTDRAVESAVGVLLYQMGVCAFVVLGYYFVIGRRLWRLHARTGIGLHLAAAVGTISILVNGIFQEEALFAPLAMGLMLALAGVAIGSAVREGIPVLGPDRARAAGPVLDGARRRPESIA